MTLGFLNIGTSEMLLIVFAALLLFGGKKLPELARGLGRGIREFKDASESIKRDISEQINNFEKDIEVEDVIVDDVEKESGSAEVPKQQQQPVIEPPAGTYQHTPHRKPAVPADGQDLRQTEDDDENPIETENNGIEGGQTIR